MKVSLLICSLFISSFSFAQSMFVLNSGKVITIDDQGMVFDSKGTVAPDQVRHLGGRFIIDQDRRIRTIDRAGNIYTKEKDDKSPIKVEHLGDNYFVSKFGRIFTIDENGYLYEGESKEREYRNIKLKGGNFLIAEKKIDSQKVLVLLVVNHFGKVLEVQVPGLNLENVYYAGGQYFVTDRGVVYTVSNDGVVFGNTGIQAIQGHEMQRGGNYFFTRNTLYTLSQSGSLMMAGVASDFGRIRYFGTNFFVTQDNRLFTISTSGTVRSVSAEFGLSNISLFYQL